MDRGGAGSGKHGVPMDGGGAGSLRWREAWGSHGRGWGLLGKMEGSVGFTWKGVGLAQ